MLQKQVTLLIILVIIILLRYSHELLIYRREVRKNDVQLNFILLKKNPTDGDGCLVFYQFYEISLRNCSKYIIGDRLIIISKKKAMTDKNDVFKIRLKDQDISYIGRIEYSGKYSIFEFLRSFFQKIEDIKKQVLFFLPALNASLITGVVFGGGVAFPEYFTQQLQITGLQHVISASGYNVSLIAELILESIRKVRIIKKRHAYCLSLLVLLLYVTVSGLTASLLRAVCAYFFQMIGKNFLRVQLSAEYSMIISSLLIICVNPALLYSLSFQLSVSATYGIIKVSQICKKLKSGNKTNWQSSIETANRKWIVNKLINQSFFYCFNSFLLAFSAQVFTLPLILSVFGKTSILGVFCNFLITWIIPYITILGIVLLLLLLFLPLSASLLFFPLWASTEFFIRGVSILSNLMGKFTFLELTLSGWQVIVSWVITFLVLTYISEKINKIKNEDK